jgi:ligand-binding sensor domain-containing protein
VFLCVLFATGALGAAELTNTPSAPPSDWAVRSWQTEDGLPQNTVNDILQTRDGFLWVGTSGGQVRFDGVRFRNFGLQDGLRSVQIFRLAEDRDGILWVGTAGGGLSRWENGRFSTFGAHGKITFHSTQGQDVRVEVLVPVESHYSKVNVA